MNTLEIYNTHPNAANRLKTIFDAKPHVKVLNMDNRRDTTRKNIKFLAVEDGNVTDITGPIARITGHKLNPQRATILVRGGDGSEIVWSLSDLLYSDGNKISMETI